MAFNADYGDTKPIEGGGYCIPDKGPYLAKIVKADPFTSKTGNPSVKVDYRIVEGKYAGKEIRWQNVTFLPKAHKWAGLSLHQLKQMRQPYEGKFKVEPEKWVGKHVIITLGIEQDLKGIDRNKVTSIRAPGVEELKALGEEPASWQLLEQAQVNGKPVGSTDGTAIVNNAKDKPDVQRDDEEVPF